MHNLQHEYMSYMAKKTQKRQTTIISLSDSNQQELENIKQQREQMLKEYQEKKQGTVATRLLEFIIFCPQENSEGEKNLKTIHLYFFDLFLFLLLKICFNIFVKHVHVLLN